MNSADRKPSLLMMEECFAAGDDRFLIELAKVSSANILQDYLQKLTTDTRPWARAILLRFLSLETHVPGQQLFFKRLFKWAEASRDHELMAAFLVTLDRMVRRSRVTRSWWDRQQRATISEELLFAAPNALPLPGQPPFTRRKKTRRLFSQGTRSYLRRRAWRYFRWLSYREPAVYVSLISTALCAYRDDDFSEGENIIDNWSLMHACYFHSDVVQFTAAHCNLAKGHSLSSLTAAPYRPENWQSADAMLQLVEVIASAQSALVRVWAMEMLHKDHHPRFGDIPFERISRLLSSDDPRVRQFATLVVSQHPDLNRVSVSTWLDLLKSAHPMLLPDVCRLMIQHVAISRLSNNQIIQLAVAAPTSVAELGFRFLTQRHAERGFSAAELVSLSESQCEATAGVLTSWVLAQLDHESMYSADRVVDFLDSANEGVRSSALTWLESPDSLGYNDPVLWSRLVETPYDDVRLRLVRSLQNRVSQPGLVAGCSEAKTVTTSSLSSMWCSVLLGVHRGGREKLLAMDQIRLAIQGNPTLADSLLPVLSVAARSLRLPERRRALASIAALVRESPSLSNSIRHHLPELTWADA